MVKQLLPFLLLLLVVSCGSSPSESHTIQTGGWSGFAADSIPVSFTVNGSSVENASLTVSYDLNTHPDTTVVWSFETDITDSGFQYTEMKGVTPWELGLDIQGAFSPPDQVQGSITAWCVYSQSGSSESDTLSASWSAEPD